MRLLGFPCDTHIPQPSPAHQRGGTQGAGMSVHLSGGQLESWNLGVRVEIMARPRELWEREIAKAFLPRAPLWLQQHSLHLHVETVSASCSTGLWVDPAGRL